MRRTFRLIFMLALSILFVAPMRSQDQHAVTPKLPELTAQRPECGLFLPMRDERFDMAKLIRADQFVNCERDGYPKNIAPPWKETLEAESKLAQACEYFAAESARDYPTLAKQDLILAADRCRITVIQIMIEKLPGDSEPSK
jgi:hypothetical protein